MSPDVLKLAAGALGVVVLLVIGKLAMIPANRLGASLFHPYRGDPWPTGVQEDDDARFRWTRRPTQPAAPDDPLEHVAFRPPLADRAAAPEDALEHVAFRPPRPAGADPATPGFEEIASPDVDVQPLARDGVHRARR